MKRLPSLNHPSNLSLLHAAAFQDHYAKQFKLPALSAFKSSKPTLTLAQRLGLFPIP